MVANHGVKKLDLTFCMKKWGFAGDFSRGSRILATII